jgi:predicted phage terminase large subunit-like protein
MTTLAEPASRRSIKYERARRSLEYFVRAAWPIIEPTTEYLDNWHIGCICDHLEAITRGGLTRLIVNMPPRYMKSTIISVLWPCWEWIRNPGQRWMFVSYAAPLANDHSRSRRLVLESAWYRGLLADAGQDAYGGRFELAHDQNQVTGYSNTLRGKMLATSVGGSILGLGGNRLVIDDPHNPRSGEDLVGPEYAYDFFKTQLYGRLDDKRRGAIVLVMQRLYENDLTAKLAETGDYQHLKLEGRAECPSGMKVIVAPARPGHPPRMWRRLDGEPLWPSREGPAELDATERAMTPAVFAGQYQQRPAPKGGLMFKRAWFWVVKARPAPATVMARVRAWDKAGTAGGGAYSVGVLMSRTYDGRFYVEDVVRGQWGDTERDRIIRETALADALIPGPAVEIVIEEEPGSGGKQSAQISVRMLVGFAVETVRVSEAGSKEARARAMASQAGAGGDRGPGNVYLVEGEWNRAFAAEYEVFPRGRYKDQVDAGSLAFNKLALAKPGGAFAAGGPAPRLGGRIER